MVHHLNRQQVILAHRQATDTYEASCAKHKKCIIKNKCNQKPKPCVDCPFVQAREVAKQVLDEKSKALQALNKQIVKQNDELSIREFHERKTARVQSRARPQKNITITTTKKQKSTKLAPIEQPKPKKEGTPSPMTTKLTRKDLTVEKYIAHKLIDHLAEQKIAEMYLFPLNAFGNWKKANEVAEKLAAAKAERDLQQAKAPAPASAVAEISEPTKEVAPQSNNACVDTDSKAVSELPAPSSEQLLQEKFAKLEAQYATIVQTNASLESNLAAVQRKLSVSEEMNQSRNEMIAILEKEIQEINESGTDSIPAVFDCDYKKLYADSESARLELLNERDRYKKEAEDMAARLEKLTEDTNAQISFFRSYESGLLERLLGEIQHNRV